MSSNDSDDTGEQCGRTTNDAGILLGDDDCGLERFVRNRYFHGKLMTARDMQLDQEYHADRLETLAQHATGTGAVCGLSPSVSQEAVGEDLKVTVEPGYALDRCGRPVLIEGTAHESFPPDGEGYTLPDPDAEPEEGELPPGVALYARVKECHTEKVPTAGSEDACREDCTYNRVVEDYAIEISEVAPDLKSVRNVAFPEREQLDSYDEETGADASDPMLQLPARSYYEDDDRDGFQHTRCETEGDPRVFLGYYARDDSDWELLEERAPRHYVYTNELLYAAIARHATDFGNPHDVVTSVDGVEHDDGDVTLESADGSILSEAGEEPGTVNLEVADYSQDELDAIAEYVRDKTLKYTVEIFYEVAAQYAGIDSEGAARLNVLARAIILAAREALAEAAFEDEYEFAAATLYLAALEWMIRDVIADSRDANAPVASEDSARYYGRTTEALVDLLPDELAERVREGTVNEEHRENLIDRLWNDEPTDELMTEFASFVEEFATVLETDFGDQIPVTELAVAQDQVVEAAGWLERAAEPATMTLPGSEQPVEARILRTAIDRPPAERDN